MGSFYLVTIFVVIVLSVCDLRFADHQLVGHSDGLFLINTQWIVLGGPVWIRGFSLFIFFKWNAVSQRPQDHL